MSINRVSEHKICACPHECSEPEPCMFCNINYDFIINRPIELKCGHSICQYCDVTIDSKKELNCEHCKKRNRKSYIEKKDTSPNIVIFDEMLNKDEKLFENQLTKTISKFRGN